MAFALPVEGEAGPFAGDALSEAITCRPDDPADDVLAGRDTGREPVLVVNEGDIVLGAVDRAELERADPGVTVAAVMTLSPTTVRPSVELADLADADQATVVTDSSGRLLGVVRAGVGDDSGLNQLGSTFLDVAHAVGDHFEGRDPTDGEVRSFLRERLVADGESPEAADAFLAAMDEPGAGEEADGP